MHPCKPQRRVSAVAICLTLCSALGLSLSCRSPVQGAISKADFAISFIFSGFGGSSKSALASQVAGAVSRLILPSAQRLTVTISSNGDDGFVATRETLIAGGASQESVSFSNVPYGSYSIKADALDGDGAIVFTQTDSDLTIDGDMGPLTLNLVPVGPAVGFPTLEATTTVSDSLSGKTAKTWAIPSASLVDKSFYYLLLAPPSLLSYLQAPDGLLLSSVASGHVADAADGVYYLTLYNPGDAPATFSLEFKTEGTALVDIAISSYQAIGFSPSSVSVSAGTPISIASLGVGSGMSGWKWYRDGLIDMANVGAAYAWTPSASDIGIHTVTATALVGGVPYSGDLTVTVTSVAAFRYTVTYSNFGATSGAVPIDATSYEPSQLVLVAANTGTLERIGDAFLGWNTSITGNGVDYVAGQLYPVSASITLYPKWSSYGITELTAISLSSGHLVPAFDTNVLSYYVTVTNATTSITPTATSLMSNSAITYGPAQTSSLNVGDNIVTVTVTSPDGSVRAFTITVNRSDVVIGSIGPAGGKVFYDKGYSSDGWRYMEAGLSDIAGPYDAWGSVEIAVATGTAIGTGMANTMAIVASIPSCPAATLCSNYSYGGMTDWFLPSQDELNELYKVKGVIGSFQSAQYWSSSQYSLYGAYTQYFNNGYQSSLRSDNIQNGTVYVRPVRSY